MQIREATVNDGEAISKLLTSLDYPNTEEFIKKKIEELLNHSDARLLVAVEENNILGFISLHFIPQIALIGEFCRISYFCIDDKYRNKGIGAQLEKASTALAKERGCDRIEVHCHTRRELAHKFYYQQGYVESPKYLLKLLK
jgi:GNAT superfamily N-acetyltransferase